MAEVRQIEACLLSREWRDSDDGVEIVLWGRAAEGAVRARFSRQESVMFVPRHAVTHAGRRVQRPLTTLHGDPIDAVYFRSQRAMLDERDRLRAELGVALESDVKPSDRFVMERFITGAIRLEGPARERRGVLWFDGPKIKTSELRLPLSVLALDLETDGFDGPILSAAIATKEHEQVFMIGADVPDERVLLARLFDEIRRLDPDVIAGWNVVEFDLTVLEARSRALRVPFAIGRGGENARVLAGSTAQRASIAKVPGRVVLDGIATLKSATYSFDRFTLEHVAQELVGRGKKIAAKASSDKLAEIRRMYAEDKPQLAAYNLEDSRLVLDIFTAADLLGFAMERAHLTGLPMDRQGGSVAAFDHLYLPRLHRKGFVAPDVGVDGDVVESPGGHVLDSVPGLYRDVLSFDFRSLYPSIIRTFRIDPLGLMQPGEDAVPGEEGATFARAKDAAILPALIDTLHEARIGAIASGNVALSRAIKIVMNSFYGVLGTPGCRFFDSRLPTSITRRGHQILDRARAFFAERGLPVIYGDTDSLFVHLESDPRPDDAVARGKELAATLTSLLADEIARDLRLESKLELRFDALYTRFLMPTTRGSDRGSKKRYAGLSLNADGSTSLTLRGLEAVRSDWTPLARRVQVELLRRVFADEPYREWLEGLPKELASGRLDDELAYRKRLRRDIDEYAGSAPPHVRAARLRQASNASEQESEIEYVVTVDGPQPLGGSDVKRRPPIDYDHYLEKQLAPVCDVVLVMLGTSFEQIAGSQRSLFG